MMRWHFWTKVREVGMTFGKKLETRNFEFELPEHNYNNRLEITRETVIRKSMPGQHYADGLNSQTRGK